MNTTTMTAEERQAAASRAQEILTTAHAQEQAGNLQQALVGFRAALTIREEDFGLFDEGTARIYNWIGNVLELTGDADGAVEMKSKAVALLESLPNDRDTMNAIAMTRQSMGISYLAFKGDSHAAVENFHAAVSIWDAMDASSSSNDQHYFIRAGTYGNIGHCLRRAGDYRGALTAFRTSLDLWTSANLPYYIASTHRDIGQILAYRGDRPGALVEFKKSFDMFEALQDQFEMGNVHVYIGRDICMRQEDYEGALREFQIALRIMQASAENGNTDFRNTIMIRECRNAIKACRENICQQKISAAPVTSE